MTEKRFSVDDFIKDYYSHIVDNNGEIKTLEEYVNYLNNLNDENEQLKKDLKTTKDGEELYIKLSGGLEEENKHLKQQIRILYNDIYFLKRFIEKRGFRAELDSDVE